MRLIAPVSRARRFATAAMLLCAGIPAAFSCREKPAGRDAAESARVSLPPARADWSGYMFRPAEKEAVEDFLRSNRNLRAATDRDRRTAEEEDIRKLYGVYHPYFLRGDVNDDGVLDFVLAFVRRDSDRDSPWFSVVVFTGRDRSGFAPGTVLERDVSLADGDLAVDRDSILITPDLDEDNTRRYRWDPVKRSHVFVRDEPEEEPPPVSQT